MRSGAASRRQRSQIIEAGGASRHQVARFGRRSFSFMSLQDALVDVEARTQLMKTLIRIVPALRKREIFR